MSLFSDKKIAGLRYMTCQSLKNPLGQVNLCFFFQSYCVKGLVKLIKRVKIAHSFLHSVSNQFHIFILSLRM